MAGRRAQGFEDILPQALDVNMKLVLAAGVQLSANADTSDLVEEKPFVITAHGRCRPEAGCVMGDSKLAFRGPLKETKREGEITKELRVTAEVSSSAASSAREMTDARVIAALTKSGRGGPAKTEELLSEPVPLVSLRQELTVFDYKFTMTEPVRHIAATSTRVDRVPLRIVPAYTLAVEPQQDVELLGRRRAPIDVFIRVHSYSAQPGDVSIGLDAPSGWSSSPQTTLALTGEGDHYAKLTLTPPEKLAAGNYVIGAYAQRRQERFGTFSEKRETPL